MAVQGSLKQGEQENGEELRNCALYVLEAVERNGVVPPWTLVPPLLALITDPSRHPLTPIAYSSPFHFS